MAFFIINALSARYEAGADDANRVGALRKHNRHEPSAFRSGNQCLALFIHGVAWILHDSAEWIREGGSGFLERYMMRDSLGSLWTDCATSPTDAINAARTRVSSGLVQRRPR